jgi:hypothetical protein
MKKTMKIIKCLLLLCIAGCFLFATSILADDIANNNDNGLEFTLVNLNTAEKLSEYMLNNIKYTSKQQRKLSRKHGHNWKTPQETFLDKYGYCYDLSAFALHGLLKNNYQEAKLLFYCEWNWGKESNSGHFVATFVDGGMIQLIDNGRLKGPFRNYKEIIDYYSKRRKIKHYRFFEYDEIPFHIRYDEMGYFCR